MKHHARRPRGSDTYPDREFAEALKGGTWDRSSSEKQAERKARQFCRQVQRALNLALADRAAEDGLDDLFVVEVSPAPDCSHLLVHVVVPADRRVDDTLGALRREAARLRSEVASAVTRKRAPELSFVPAVSDGGEDA